VLKQDADGHWTAELANGLLVSRCGFAVELEEAEGDGGWKIQNRKEGDPEKGGAHVTGFRLGDRLSAERRIERQDNGLRVLLKVTNISDKPVRLLKVTPFRGVVNVSPDVRVLLNDWERYYGEAGVKRLDEHGALDSAWMIDLYDPAGGKAVAAGALSGRRMFTSLRASAKDGNVHLTVTGDTRSGDRGVLLKPGRSLEADPVALIGASCPHAAVETYADWVRHYNNVQLNGLPSGWLDWYCHYGRISEQTVLANVDAIEQKLKGYGLKYIQIDDGWQKIREYTFYEQFNLHTTACSGAPWEPNEHFPNGMKGLAEAIKRKGYKVGLWLRPFCVMNEAKEYKDKKPWVLPYSPDAPMPDRACVDVSDENARQWLANLFEKITRKWGYDYVKYDFVTYDLMSNQEFDLPRHDVGTFRIKNPEVTSAQAFHEALRRFRETVPEETFLLACNCLAGSAFGVADGYRISGDVLLSEWDVTRRMLRSVAYRYYLNGVVWRNDPDVLMVGEPLPVHCAQFWASLVGLSGGMIMLGDSMPDLSEERADILRKVLPPHDGQAKPLRLFETKDPELWRLHVERDFGSWDVAGLFNWRDEPATLLFDFSEFGLSPDAPCALFDFWAGEYLGTFTGNYESQLDGSTCRVVGIRPLKDVPQVLASGYHVAQGANELRGERWDRQKHVLEVDIKAAPGSLFRLFVSNAAGCAMKSARVAGEEAECLPAGHGAAEIRFRVPQTGEGQVCIDYDSEG